jgi:hypothetical protein
VSHYDALSPFPDAYIAYDHTVDEDIRKSNALMNDQLGDLND